MTGVQTCALPILDKVNRQFRVPAPNMLWVSDFIYAAFVIDANVQARNAHVGINSVQVDFSQ